LAFIDPRTFLLVANLFGILCAFVLWVQARSFPDDIQGLRDWARGVILIGCASGLASMRGHLPDLLGIVGASGLLLVGQLWLIVGLQRYAGQAPSWRPALDAIAAVLLLIVWLTYGSPHYQARLLIMGLAHIGLFSFGALLAWRARPAAFGHRFLAGCFVLGVVIALWRIATLPRMPDRATTPSTTT